MYYLTVTYKGAKFLEEGTLPIPDFHDRIAAEKLDV